MKQRILLASGNAKKLAELRALCGELPVQILSPADLPHGLPDVIEDGSTFLANARKKALAAAVVAAEQLGADVWALADDSGLCVDALNGAPGVFSARFASLVSAESPAPPGRSTEEAPLGAGAALPERSVGEAALGAACDLGNCSDEDNNQMLLRKLKGVATEHRGGAFYCVIVVARVSRSAGTKQSADVSRAGEELGNAEAARSMTAEVLVEVEGSVRGRLLEERDGEGGFGYDPLFWHQPSGKTFARLSASEKARVSHRGQAVRKLKAQLHKRLRGKL